VVIPRPQHHRTIGDSLVEPPGIEKAVGGEAAVVRGPDDPFGVGVFGSDWPCSSPRPFEGIRVATTRQTIEDLPVGGWTPAEKLTLTQALSAYTAGVSAQAFADLAERPWGTLRVGHSADLAFLDRDPRAVASAGALTEIAVVRTWLAGRETFANP